jgi:hypothetical protein
MLLAGPTSVWIGPSIYRFFQDWWHPVPTSPDLDLSFDPSPFDRDTPYFGGFQGKPLTGDGGVEE